MEQSSKSLILFTFIIIFLVVVICTVKRVYDNHIDAEYTVLEKKLTESAKSCFLDKICEGEETTFGFLVKSGYLTSTVNPVTKEYIQDDLVIKCIDYKCSVNVR